MLCPCRPGIDDFVPRQILSDAPWAALELGHFGRSGGYIAMLSWKLVTAEQICPVTQSIREGGIPYLPRVATMFLAASIVDIWRKPWRCAVSEQHKERQRERGRARERTAPKP